MSEISYSNVCVSSCLFPERGGRPGVRAKRTKEKKNHQWLVRSDEDFSYHEFGWYLIRMDFQKHDVIYSTYPYYWMYRTLRSTCSAGWEPTRGSPHVCPLPVVLPKHIFIWSRVSIEADYIDKRGIFSLPAGGNSTILSKNQKEEKKLNLKNSRERRQLLEKSS